MTDFERDDGQQVKLLLLKGWLETDILHQFGTKFGSMCVPTHKFEVARFGEEEVELPEVFNITLPMDEGDGQVLDCEAGSDVTQSVTYYADDIFHKTVSDTLRECEGFPDIRNIAMTQLNNWRHKVKNMVARQKRKVGSHLGKQAQKFKRVSNDDNSQKRHPSFVDNMYRARKQKLRRKRSLVEKEADDMKATESVAKPFKKIVEVKETTTQWMDREAEEAAAGKKKVGRRGKKLVRIMQDGTQEEVKPTKTSRKKKQPPPHMTEPSSAPRPRGRPKKIRTESKKSPTADDMTQSLRPTGLPNEAQYELPLSDIIMSSAMNSPQCMGLMSSTASNSGQVLGSRSAQPAQVFAHRWTLKDVQPMQQTLKFNTHWPSTHSICLNPSQPSVHTTQFELIRNLGFTQSKTEAANKENEAYVVSLED